MGSSRRLSYRTTTVNVVLWFRLPEVAVIVAVYVPLGVPDVVWVDDELPPPHPSAKTTPITITEAASEVRRSRLRTHRNADPKNISVQASGIRAAGKVI